MTFLSHIQARQIHCRCHLREYRGSGNPLLGLLYCRATPVEAKLPRSITEGQLSEARFIRRRWELDELGPPEKTRRSFLQRMSEHLDSALVFEGFESFEGAVEVVLYELQQFWIDPHGNEGQQLLKTFCAHAKKEMYGDFERWRTCEACEHDFVPPMSLEYVYRIIDGAPILCPACVRKRKKVQVLDR